MKPKVKQNGRANSLVDEKVKIEFVEVADLIPDARNSRTHSEAQIAAIAGSIAEFRWTSPILINGKNKILSGHARVLAARKLGIEKAPCVRLTHLTEAQERAYVIADNRLAEFGSGWDVEILKIEVDELKRLDFDFKKIGWDEPELEIILNPKDKINSSPEVKIKTQWLIIVECKDESEQIKILEKCLAEGWNCKAMSS